MALWNEMVPDDAGLPPMDKISMIGIWVETVLYGVNCTMFGLCVFILFCREKTATRRWILVVVSTILFLLCTAYVGASLQQLLDAFVYAPVGVPNYSITYWFDRALAPRILKNNLFLTLVLVQDSILIWRLYVVYMNNWRVIILPILLSAGCVGTGYASSVVFMLHNIPLHVAFSLLLPAWAFGFTFNASITLAIAGRLWWVGRRTASLTVISSNRLSSSIYLIVESGFIISVANTLWLVFCVIPNALAGLDIAFQLSAFAQLLIFVQLGLADRRCTLIYDPSRTIPSTLEEITFREGNLREQLGNSLFHSVPYELGSVHDTVFDGTLPNL